MLVEKYSTMLTDFELSPIDVSSVEITDYVDFKTAARMIDSYWTTHYLHKQIRTGRLDTSAIIVVINRQMSRNYTSSKGKTYYLHRDEVERFKVEEYPNIKQRKRKDICEFCRKPIKECKPCNERIEFKIKEEADIRRKLRERAKSRSKRTNSDNES